MAYWIFKYNLEDFAFDRWIADGHKTLTWLVAQHKDEIGPGDTVFAWETGPSRGIRAVFVIDDAPRVRPELDSEKPYSNGEGERLRVACTLRMKEINLPASDLKSVKGLQNLSVFRKNVVQQGTNFEVTPDEARILLELIERIGSFDENEATASSAIGH